MRKLIVSIAALLLVLVSSGCSTTLGNIGLGLGIGAVGTLSGLYCALAC